MSKQVSLQQIEANRRNAQLSTGPKTDRGKALVALNAVQHGILTAEVLLEGEDEKTLVEFGKRMRAELQPVGELESLLVDRIITSAWRLRRLLSVEVGIFRSEMDCYLGKEADVGLAFIRDGNAADAFSKLSRYESTIERGMYRALHELQRLQAASTGQNVPLPVVIELHTEPDEERS